MVEELRPSGEPAPGRPEGGSAVSRWITRLLVGVFGITAAVRYLLAEPPGRLPPALPAEPPRPAGEEIHYPDGRIEHPLVRHERTDATFRAILFILLALMGIASFHFWILLWFFHHYGTYQSAIKQSPYPLAPAPSSALPPEPRLEPLDRTSQIETSNVYLRLARKEAELHEYGPTPETGFVHIPLEQAWAQLAGKLPARKAPAGAGKKENGLVDAGEPNSGRMFREKPRWYQR